MHTPSERPAQSRLSRIAATISAAAIALTGCWEDFPADTEIQPHADISTRVDGTGSDAMSALEGDAQ